MFIWVTFQDVAWRQSDVVRELTIYPNEHGYNRYLGDLRSSQINTASVGLYPWNHRTTEWLGLKETLMIV